MGPLSMAVNISAAELHAPGFVASVREILKETGLEPQFLEFELTEKALTGDPRPVSDALKELKDIGVRLALDDFGTGYSSLTHLQRFPIDTIKIDHSFVHELTANANGVEIVATLIGVGRNLHMQVVAEGVETREQLEILQRHGCSRGQGYYFSRPVPAEEFNGPVKRSAVAAALA